MTRILSNHVLAMDGIHGLSLIEIDGDRAVVAPFECETHSTQFHDAPIALLKSSAVDEFLLDDIAHTMASYPRKSAIERLDQLFRASDLYYDSEKIGEYPVALPLK